MTESGVGALGEWHSTEARQAVRWIHALAATATLIAAALIGAGDADLRSTDQSNAAARISPIFASPGSDLKRGPIAGQRLILAQMAPSYPGGSFVWLFNRPGLLGGFAAGFLGCGLFGVLFGQGLFSGLSGAASVCGLMFQLALLVMLGRVIWNWWRGRNVPEFSGLSPRQLADPYLRSRSDVAGDLQHSVSDLQQSVPDEFTPDGDDRSRLEHGLMVRERRGE